MSNERVEIDVLEMWRGDVEGWHKKNI